MDLDEMKNQMKRVSAPGIGDDALRDRSVDNLIAALKVEDARDKKRVRRITIFFAVAGLLYAGLFTLTWIAPPDVSPDMHRAILGLCAVLFLSLGVYGRIKSQELSGIDYTEPSRAFLENVERRYRIVRAKELTFIIPYFVILAMTCAAALMAGLERYVPSLDPATRLVIASIFLPTTLVASIFLGWGEWKKRKQPLLRKVREMQANLNKGGTEVH